MRDIAQASLDHPYEACIDSLSARSRIYWNFLRAADYPVRHLLAYHGFGLAARAAGSLLGVKEVLSVRVLDKVNFEVRLTDAYWLSFVMRQTLYERELFPFFDYLRRYRCGFIDAGANIGWWSVMADSLFHWPCVAIEAARELLPLIEANRRANNGGFTILHRVLWNSEDGSIPFRYDPVRHACGRVDPGADGGVACVERIATVTLDAASKVLAGAAGARPEAVIVKLDVEGAENMALEGAEGLLSRDVFFIYEDHGCDPTCSATAAMLEHGLRIYSLDHGGGLHPVAGLGAARALKRDRYHGYNFVAVNDGRLATEAIEGFTARRSGQRV